MTSSPVGCGTRGGLLHGQWETHRVRARAELCFEFGIELDEGLSQQAACASQHDDGDASAALWTTTTTMTTTTTTTTTMMMMMMMMSMHDAGGSSKEHAQSHRRLA
jgi:hypothetical protein